MPVQGEHLYQPNLVNIKQLTESEHICKWESNALKKKPVPLKSLIDVFMS